MKSEELHGKPVKADLPERVIAIDDEDCRTNEHRRNEKHNEDDEARRRRAKGACDCSGVTIEADCNRY